MINRKLQAAAAGLIALLMFTNSMAAAREIELTTEPMMEMIEIAEEEVPLAGGIAVLDPARTPVPSGTQTKSAGGVIVDYSNTAYGYVMVKGDGSYIKVQVKGPTGIVYTYTLTGGSGGGWDTFPLTEGNGNYSVAVYRSVGGNKYAAVTNASFNAVLADQFAPFIRPNQYVNYQAAPATIATAASLTAGMTDTLKMVTAIYDFVVGNIKYDQAKAASIPVGYLPPLDQVLATRSGICFDYAALMAGMLRSQGIPCKLVVGYAGNAYHSWLSVYTPDMGWIDGVIYFNGTTWQRLDPTFASTGKKSAAVLSFISTETNYVQKYIY